MKTLSIWCLVVFSLLNSGTVGLFAQEKTDRLQPNAVEITETDVDQSNQSPLITSAPGQWSVAKAEDWSEEQGWLVGFNYVPSYACNTTEFWQRSTFDLKCIDKELGWAEDIGYNSLRVFLPYIVWKKDPSSFKKRFELFLRCASKHGLRVMPVLFDDCSFGYPKQLDPLLGEQRKLQPGVPFSSWTPCPGQKAGASAKEQVFLKRYVQDIVSTYARDSRINCWDLFNEPTNSTQVGSAQFLRTAFEWARSANPTQPLTVAFWTIRNDINTVIMENSDIVTFHGYAPNAILDLYITVFRVFNRPVLCTEWMARIVGSEFQADLSMLADRSIGCYQWGLVNGRTQAQFPWFNQVGQGVDPVYGWMHDIFLTDGTPYKESEVDAIEQIIEDNHFQMRIDR